MRLPGALVLRPGRAKGQGTCGLVSALSLAARDALPDGQRMNGDVATDVATLSRE